ncbi:MAG: hypothetical protein Kow0063_34130 [Anaerolineae bacterium]
MDPGIPSAPTNTTETLTPSPPTLRWLPGLALIAGLVALVLGLLAGGLFIWLWLAGRREADALSMATLGVSIAAMGLGLGGGLAWIGYRSLRARPSAPFRPGAVWLGGCLGTWLLALVLGQVSLSLDRLAPLLFPPFHLLGMALPALGMLALVGYGLRQSSPAPSRRQVLGQIAWGALGATLIAFTLEALAAALGLVVVVVIIALRPDGPAQLASLQAMLADPSQLADPQRLAAWLLKPEIILSVAGLLVIVAPLVEEGVKSLGVPLLSLGGGRRPSLAQGWVWGMAAGAGFAVVEGVFNSTASLPFWAGIVLLRGSATAMHLITAGLSGLGWAATLTSRRPLPLVGSYLASVTLHSLWNGLTVLVVVASLWMMAHPGDPVGVVGVLPGLTGLVLLAGVLVGVAAWITLWLRHSQHPA